MSQYVQVIEDEEEDGIGIMKALAILSANEHRDTSLWKLVEEQHFKNGRQVESHMFVANSYEKPNDFLEPVKMLVFEAKAIAKSYIMEGIEQQLEGIYAEDDEDDADTTKVG
jgi:hypothetical protein